MIFIIIIIIIIVVVVIENYSWTTVSQNIKC